MEDITAMIDTMDDHRVPDSEQYEASSSKRGPRIIIRLPNSAKLVETDADYDAGKEKTEWHTCETCVGKSFRSRKALFGHMRLHNSKNTNKEAKKNPNSITDEVHALDIDLCNTRWLTSDKRGRKRKDVTGPLIDEDLVNAAIILMSFTKPLEYSKRRCLGIESADGKLVALVRSTSEDECTEKLEISCRGATIACSDLLPNVTEAEDCGNAEISRSKTARSHICRICERAFKTHQALGGHVASHNKGGGVPMVDEHKCRLAKIKVQEHKCRRCPKVFGSGQSLGGHMRKHYIRPDENDTTYDDFAEKICSVPHISDGSDGSSLGKCVHDFDLNELPMQGEGGI